MERLERERAEEQVEKTFDSNEYEDEDDDFTPPQKPSKLPEPPKEVVVYQDDTPEEPAPKRKRRTKAELAAAAGRVEKLDRKRNEEQTCDSEEDDEQPEFNPPKAKAPKDSIEIAKRKTVFEKCFCKEPTCSYENCTGDGCSIVETQNAKIAKLQAKVPSVEEKPKERRPMKINGEEPITYNIGNYIVRLVKPTLEVNADPEEISRIDYSNLFGEIVTISALLNRVGNMRAETESMVARAKLELKIFESKKRSFYDKQAGADGVKMTEQKREDCLLQDDEVVVKRYELIQTEHLHNQMDVLYWSVKSKDEKLSRLLQPVKPEEFVEEIIEGSINGFIIKKSKHVL
jgi:hypothetical protein